MHVYTGGRFFIRKDAEGKKCLKIFLKCSTSLAGLISFGEVSAMRYNLLLIVIYVQMRFNSGFDRSRPKMGFNGGTTSLQILHAQGAMLSFFLSGQPGSDFC
jgi:hypothetical protein